MQSDQLTAAAQKAAAMEGATIAEVSNLRLELQECEVKLQNTIVDRDNRNRQLEVLLNSTVEWERRVESSDMEYQAMSAALGAKGYQMVPKRLPNRSGNNGFLQIVLIGWL